MRTKQLGHTDMHITSVGFGAWAIGGSGWEYGWGSQEDTASVKAILRALEHGVNWIDTAAIYGLGHSEVVVARALSEWKGQRPFVFTKCGLIGETGGKIAKVLNAKSIQQECEASLRRLATDCIDLYQIHWPTDGAGEIEEAWSALTELQKAGKVRWIGVSNFSVKELERCKPIAPIASLQPPYSLLRRSIEGGILPYCKQENIGVIVYSPMTSGLLTGAMTKERAASLPADDWRSRNPEFQEPKLSRNLEFVEKLRAIGERHDATPGAVAIAWTTKRPEVTAAIVGARSPEQVDGVVQADALRLSTEEWKEIEAAIP